MEGAQGACREWWEHSAGQAWPSHRVAFTQVNIKYFNCICLGEVQPWTPQGGFPTQDPTGAPSQQSPQPWKSPSTHRKKISIINSLSTAEPQGMGFVIQKMEQTKIFHAWLLCLQTAFLKGLKEHVPFAFGSQDLVKTSKEKPKRLSSAEKEKNFLNSLGHSVLLPK